MKKLIIVLSAFISLLHVSGQTPDITNAYPDNVPLVLLANAATLQDTLDKYDSIRLEGATYSVSITMTSGQKIYGLPDTWVTSLEIAPGSVGVLVNNVYVMTGLTFPESDLITRDNYFMGIGNKMFVNGGTLENNTFFNYPQLTVNNSTSGYIRNNRFIRGKTQGDQPIVLNGNQSQNSYGNTFLWINLLSVQGRTFEAENQRHLTLAITDVESWNAQNKGDGKALWWIQGGDYLTTFSASSGQNYPNVELTGLYDVDVKKITSYGSFGGYSNLTDPNILLRSGVEQFSNVGGSSFVNYTFQADNQNAIVNGIEASSDTVKFQDVAAENLNNYDKAQLGNLLEIPTGTAWELYNHSTSISSRLPDSAVINDHTTYIQNRIDSEDVVLLDSGIYYVSEALYLGSGQGLIGKGKGVTVIRAIIDTFSIIQNKQVGGFNDFDLMNLSLEDAANGIRLFQTTTEAINVSGNIVSHVEFYNMSNAGIFCDIKATAYFGVDNFSVAYSDFIRSNYGMQQVTESGGDSQRFVDKIVFYRSRFIEDSIGVYMQAIRGGNANALIDCIFKDNESKDVYFSNQNIFSVSLCQFESPLVDYVFEARSDLKILNSTINSGKAGAYILPYSVIAQGVDINGSGAELFIPSLKPEEAKPTLINCNISGVVSATEMTNALFYNTAFANNPALSNKLVQVKGTVNTTVINEASTPQAGILIDWSPSHCDSMSLIINGTVEDNTSESLGGINISVTGGTTPYTYLWSNDETTQDISELPGGDYSVLVSDDSNCYSTANYNVEAISDTLLNTQFSLTTISEVVSNEISLGGVYKNSVSIEYINESMADTAFTDNVSVSTDTAMKTPTFILYNEDESITTTLETYSTGSILLPGLDSNSVAISYINLTPSDTVFAENVLVEYTAPILPKTPTKLIVINGIVIIPKKTY